MLSTNSLKNKKILIVDDDVQLCNSLSRVLSQQGVLTQIAFEGKGALKSFFDFSPDLILLDVRMPQMSGWEVCRQIRALSSVPIIMLTGLSDDDHVVRSLKYGADDFVTKPFSRAVLLARVEAVLRRSSEGNAPESPSCDMPKQYEDDHLIIDLARREVIAGGKRLQLSATEFDLLSLLLENAGHVLSYDAILNEVWGWDAKASTDYVHVYMSRLRSKLEPNGRRPQYLITKRGHGYFFNRPH